MAASALPTADFSSSRQNLLLALPPLVLHEISRHWVDYPLDHALVVPSSVAAPAKSKLRLVRWRQILMRKMLERARERRPSWALASFSLLLEDDLANATFQKEVRTDYRLVSVRSEAFFDEDVELIEVLLKNGFQSFPVDEYHWRPTRIEDHFPEKYCDDPLFLSYGFSGAIGKIFSLLIHFGWDLDVTSRYDTDMTVLHRAASCGDIASINLLLDHGASVEGARKDSDNIVRETPLMVANDATTARFLLSRGAKVYARDRFGKTALFRAKNFEIASLLVEHGVDVNVRDNNRDTPLTEHCKYSLHGRLDLVSLLLDNGADVARLPPDRWFLAPLHAATIHLATDLVIRLLQGGAPPDFGQVRKGTPLFM